MHTDHACAQEFQALNPRSPHAQTPCGPHAPPPVGCQKPAIGGCSMRNMPKEWDMSKETYKPDWYVRYETLFTTHTSIRRVSKVCNRELNCVKHVKRDLHKIKPRYAIRALAKRPLYVKRDPAYLAALERWNDSAYSWCLFPYRFLFSRFLISGIGLIFCGCLLTCFT